MGGTTDFIRPEVSGRFLFSDTSQQYKERILVYHERKIKQNQRHCRTTPDLGKNS